MLQQDVLKRGIRSLAIIGLAKNVGKTTVLNGLVAEAEREAIPVGLVSIGVDGEERDVWSGRHKPPIHVPAGSLVATAGPLLDVGGGVWEVLDSTGVHSAVGEIFIARALQPTRVKLAGITAARAAARIDQQFRHFGAVLTLVDGAYDRKAAASPLVTEGAVCVVGASMARTLEEMVQKTEETVRLFTLPLCKDPVLRKAAQRAAAERKLFAVDGTQIDPLPFSSLFSNRKVLREELKRRSWTGLSIPGALTDHGLTLLSELGHPFQLILDNPTCNFVSLSVLRRFFQAGGSIGYFHPIHLAAIAVNPLSPAGFSFHPQEIKERIAEVCAPLPVVDVVRDPV